MPRASDIGRPKSTAQTRRKHRKSSFARLCDKGEVSGSMLRAAMEIEEVYMGLTAGLWIRPPTPERVSGGGAHDMQHRLALAHKIRYLPWARVMGRQLALVVDILIDTRFLSDLAETYGQPQGELKRRFLRALLTYALMARWTDHEELADFDQLHGGAVPTP